MRYPRPIVMASLAAFGLMHAAPAAGQEDRQGQEASPRQQLREAIQEKQLRPSGLDPEAERVNPYAVPGVQPSLNPDDPNLRRATYDPFFGQPNEFDLADVGQPVPGALEAYQYDENQTEPADAVLRQEVRQAVARIASTAMTAQGLEALVDRLALADEQRLEPVEREWAVLDEAIGRYRQAWEERYGSPMELAGDDATLDFIDVRITNRDGALNAWAILDAERGLPRMQISMVKDPQQRRWQMNIPAEVTKQRLVRAMVSGIRPVVEGQPPLPASEDDARRLTIHGTLASLMGQVRTREEGGMPPRLEPRQAGQRQQPQTAE